MEECLVLGASHYDFEDEAGKRVEGYKVVYLTGDVEADADRRGVSALSATVTKDVFGSLHHLPGRYQMNFKQRPGRGGKATLTLVSAQLMEPLDGFMRSVLPSALLAPSREELPTAPIGSTGNLSIPRTSTVSDAAAR